jgi:hypothetical protein
VRTYVEGSQSDPQMFNKQCGLNVGLPRLPGRRHRRGLGDVTVGLDRTMSQAAGHRNERRCPISCRPDFAEEASRGRDGHRAMRRKPLRCRESSHSKPPGLLARRSHLRTPAEYKPGLERAIANGGLWLHERGTFVRITEARRPAN